MAYINVSEWKPDQVTDWLRGLDDSMNKYVYSFTNNQVGGQQLLHIRPYELEQLGMVSIGHQEVVLEAVESLRNFHYNLDKENLQFLALHVATAAKNLRRQLENNCDKKTVETGILKDITRTIATIKRLISWLDYAPFKHHLQYNEIRKNMLKLGLEMAASAQRDRFVENPGEQIRIVAGKLAKLADYIIQDITDPMLLQPASLNLVTLKKRESDLGFKIVTSFQGVHRVSELTYNSPAHTSGKIQEGDEIVQINYQTIVGWQDKTVIMLLQDSPPDVLLTLKKRPKHTNIYGEMYMQPYRLPSKKRTMTSRWGEPVPSPQSSEFIEESKVDLVAEKTVATVAEGNSSDNDSVCSDILTPTDEKPSDKEIRLYYPKPRVVLQRRNTICGYDISVFRKVINFPLSHERNFTYEIDPSSPSLRDKSVSFGFGLEIAPRPTTCLGISSSNGKFNELIGSLPDIKGSTIPKSKPGISKVVRFDSKLDASIPSVDEKYICNVEDTILETFEPIPFADEEDETKAPTEEPKDLVQAVNAITVTKRGRLDKSHSTPTYDNSEGESETPPPAIEPRKEFLTAPAPPPRPRKQCELTPPAVPPHTPKTFALQERTFTAPIPIPVKQQRLEIIELVTPPKGKSLTLKKKKSLLAKRRNIALKDLATGDIRGHLYRRMKNKEGVTFWSTLYFVLVETVLYGFRTKVSSKANCIIFLPGFTVAHAKEIHSKPYAFKVYHPSKTFYLAAESNEKLIQWMEYIQLAASATLEKYANSATLNVNPKELYSETENSDEENCEQPSPQSNIGSISKDGFVKSPDTPTQTTPKHDYFGSLKKFTKTNLPFKSLSEKKPSSDVPVPTNHFRTYRRMPGGTAGLQIGANNNIFYEANHQPQLVNTPPPPKERKMSATSMQGISPPNIFAPKPILQEKPLPKTPPLQAPPTKSNLSFNSIHASNPNLVEFDYQTSKNVDYSFLKLNTSNPWEPEWNLKNYITLNDLMLQQLEEDNKEMYNNRVYMGKEKKSEHKPVILQNPPRPKKPDNLVNKPEAPLTALKQFNKIQSRSLPKTPDYEMSFKPDDKEIQRARTKEGQKLRDFGYEFIYGDEPVNTAVNPESKPQQTTVIATGPKKTSSNASDIVEKSSRAGSFKKTKGKFEAFKTSSERLFQSTFHSTTLPSKRTHNFTEYAGGGIKKSHTYNNEFKDSSRKVDAHRKNSAPTMPILSKLSFSSTSSSSVNKPAKEKKFLGSPRFHRAIFGRTSSVTHQDYDNEIFCSINLPKATSSHYVPGESGNIQSMGNNYSPQVEKPSIPTSSSSTTPEYPNMQCPPVFEPETYSLSEPNTSLTLLKKRNNIEDPQ